MIEPAKTEYRGLIHQPGFENLLVFTLGDETTAPFRFNPFELLPGVRLEVHLEALNVAINAAMPQFGVLPTIIEEALEEIYTANGWRLSRHGAEDAGSGPDRRLFPTMADFYRAAVQAMTGRGYRGELNDNIQAAVKGRIGSLLRGSKGRMFNCRRSLPPDLLFGRPVVLELDSLSDDAQGADDDVPADPAARASPEAGAGGPVRPPPGCVTCCSSKKRTASWRTWRRSATPRSRPTRGPRRCGS